MRITASHQSGGRNSTGFIGAAHGAKLPIDTIGSRGIFRFFSRAGMAVHRRVGLETRGPAGAMAVHGHCESEPEPSGTGVKRNRSAAEMAAGTWPQAIRRSLGGGRPRRLVAQEDRHPACHGRRASSLSFHWRTGGTPVFPDSRDGCPPCEPICIGRGRPRPLRLRVPRSPGIVLFARPLAWRQTSN
jgi:hypothetical protein